MTITQEDATTSRTVRLPACGAGWRSVRRPATRLVSVPLSRFAVVRVLLGADTCSRWLQPPRIPGTEHHEVQSACLLPLPSCRGRGTPRRTHGPGADTPTGSAPAWSGRCPTGSARRARRRESRRVNCTSSRTIQQSTANSVASVVSRGKLSAGGRCQPGREVRLRGVRRIANTAPPSK